MIEGVERLDYGLWLVRLDELRKTLRKELMPFPDVRAKLCKNFGLKWRVVQKYLHIIWERGYIEVSSCHGVKLSSYGESLLVYLEDPSTGAKFYEMFD